MSNFVQRFVRSFVHFSGPRPQAPGPESGQSDLDKPVCDTPPCLTGLVKRTAQSHFVPGLSGKFKGYRRIRRLLNRGVPTVRFEYRFRTVPVRDGSGSGRFRFRTVPAPDGSGPTTNQGPRPEPKLRKPLGSGSGRFRGFRLRAVPVPDGSGPDPGTDGLVLDGSGSRFPVRFTGFMLILLFIILE